MYTCLKSLEASVLDLKLKVSHAPLPLRDVAVGADSAGLGVADPHVDLARLLHERNLAVLRVRVVAHFSLQRNSTVSTNILKSV